MKKKLLSLSLAIIAVFFGCSLVLVSAFKLSQPSVVLGLADAGEVQESTAAATDEAEPAVEEVDYYLAYPGILPDHPLYWLKMARDRVWGWLIREPRQKSDWLLLMADKRIGAAQALVEGGKAQLGITTASKAEKYLAQAVAKLKESDDSEAERTEKLTLAVKKHREVLQNMAGRVSADEQPGLFELAQQSEKLLEGLFVD